MLEGDTMEEVITEVATTAELLSSPIMADTMAASLSSHITADTTNLFLDITEIL